MATGRLENDFPFTVDKDHIINGVQGAKSACGIKKGLAPIVGESVTVGLDDSVDGYPKPWAAWEAIEPSTGRMRCYSGDITPGDKAYQVISTNDTGDRRRLAGRWPADGVEFSVVNVTSRYKQSTKKHVATGAYDEQRVTRAAAARAAVAKPRKQRRTMRRLSVTT